MTINFRTDLTSQEKGFAITLVSRDKTSEWIILLDFFFAFLITYVKYKAHWNTFVICVVVYSKQQIKYSTWKIVFQLKTKEHLKKAINKLWWIHFYMRVQYSCTSIKVSVVINDLNTKVHLNVPCLIYTFCSVLNLSIKRKLLLCCTVSLGSNNK